MINCLHKFRVFLLIFCGVTAFIKPAEAKLSIGEYRNVVNQSHAPTEVFLFNSFAIVDLSLVKIYLIHEHCNGTMGSLIFYNVLMEDMSNMEVSIDGGVSYLKPMLDNFGNVVLINIAVGRHEIYIRTTEGNQIERFLGTYEILNRERVDLDKDGITACLDVDDHDPCIPVDCDLSQGVGCDLIIKKSTAYEFCHFQNLLEPEKSAFPISVDLVDSAGEVSYQWSTGDTTSVAMVNPISDTKYFVTVSDQTGCVLTDSLNLKVHFIPDIDINIQHIGCDGEPSVLTLFSRINDDLSDVELSLDGGVTYFTPIMDNFGNIVEIGMGEGNYELHIRHKDYRQCDKIFKTIDIRHQSFFDEDGDGIQYCEDPDDDDECVPVECENCEIVNKTDFENDDTQGWNLDTEQVSITESQALSGRTSIQLFDQNASITSENFDTEDYMSFKFYASVYSRTLELDDNVTLLQSIDGGESFIEIERWSIINDFQSGNWFELFFNGSIPADVTQLMFRLKLGSDSSFDDIFIDNIEIELCEIQFSESESIECSIVNIDDADSFNGFWKFGGEDARLSTEHASSGIFSYHLQNGNGRSSSIISSPFSIPAESELEVSFVYTPISMERAEFFALEVSTNNGFSYVPYSNWVSGDFVNGEQYQESAIISFPEAEADIRIRFTCYANSQYDHIYLDDIKIETCTDSQNAAEEDTEIDIEEEKALDNNLTDSSELEQGNLVEIEQPSAVQTQSINVNIFPNPAHDELRFSLDQIQYEDDKSITVTLTQIDGAVLKQYSSSLEHLSQLRIDISNLNSGFYLVHVFDQTAVYFKEKLVKI